jgi:CBS domain-containing membrane protein
MQRLLRLPLLLAGANWRERTIAALGALLGIGAAAALGQILTGSAAAGLLLAAPVGASAVLVFAVPSSPLAQPWPVIGGNAVSALVGVATAQLLGHGALAAGLAVGAAILAMSALRCLHPPGGGTVLLPVLGGPAVVSQGYGFALLPTLDATLLVIAGLLFHRLSGHSYPHRPLAMPATPRLLAEDIDAALAEAGESFDVGRADLEALLERAERHAALRHRPRRASDPAAS